jgi:hypothetical protein
LCEDFLSTSALEQKVSKKRMLANLDTKMTNTSQSQVENRRYSQDQLTPFKQESGIKQRREKKHKQLNYLENSLEDNSIGQAL